MRSRVGGLLAVVLGLSGCQRLEETPAGGPGDGPEGSGSTFEPGDATTTGDGDDTTAETTVGEPGPEDVECVPGLTSAGFSGDPSELAGIETFVGNLYLYDVQADELQWLHCLQEVTGEMSIANSPALSSLEGLEQLHTVGGTLRIEDDPLLTDLDPLAGLSSVGGLELRDGPALTSMAGLSGVQTSGDVTVTGTPLLPSVTFDGLTEMGHLSITACSDLVAVEVPNLVTTNGSVSLVSNPSLTTLEFGALEHVAGLELRYLDALTSLDGLGSLRETSVVRISWNPQLLAVHLPSVEIADEFAVTYSPLITAIELPAIQTLAAIELHGLPALPQLPSLPPTAGLVSVGLSELPLVTTLDPLAISSPELEKLVLEHLAALDDISILAGTTDIAGDLSLWDLPQLGSLDALASLEHAVDVYLRELPLVDGLGLTSLQTVDLFVDIFGLPQLTSMEGMGALSSAELLRLNANEQLQSLDGLTAISLARLTVVNNPSLTDIQGVWPSPDGALQSLSGRINISGNASLSQCIVDDFVAALIAIGWTALGESDTTDNLACPP